MALPHFYLEQQILSCEGQDCFALQLSADDIKHARVLRLACGEHLAVIDASSDYFECEIVSFDDDMIVRIAKHLDTGQNMAPSVILIQGLAKGDKMETVIRHATELGVRRFIPFTSDRTVVKLDQKRAEKKLTRWNAIAKSAAMQSGQLSIPLVDPLCSLAQLSHVLGEVDLLLVCWEETPVTQSMKALLSSFAQTRQCGQAKPNTQTRQTAQADQTDQASHATLEGKIAQADQTAQPTEPTPNPARIGVVIGPEGGLAKEEVERLLEEFPCAHLVSLGPSILRTETAGIVTPALVMYELGGFELPSQASINTQD